ncbi:uncharacterized protein Aud_001947 [Aspergillus udagawae]|uniref:Uncharacterized protein n=1 Tax=Aspergillus udagawae TaxID=91492 RepID=A0A8E0V4D2_9EURO|nr:uncharacterized protein Aud_001947 [Aspergillus udagawae]GIC94618.1 hypothetical protein Aud_001947 [Aspergillus udagawae]
MPQGNTIFQMTPSATWSSCAAIPSFAGIPASGYTSPKLKAHAQDISPLVPQRGSISASGDLSPLPYLGGLVERNPDILVKMEEPDEVQVVTADEALKARNAWRTLTNEI